MHTDRRLQSLLDALAAHTGLTSLTMNDDNVCRLVIDDSIAIDIEHAPGTDNVQVHSVVGSHPRGDVELCHRLLAANLFGQGTGGAVLALDEDREEVLLTQGFDLSVTTPEKFTSTIDGFVSYLQTWIAELMDRDADDDSEDEASEPSSGFIRV